MEKIPFFSIIIPTLNEEKYLPKLLTSLTKQTYTDFEVIVVDGYSEDGTEHEAKKFSKALPQFSFIRSKERNLPYQRNLGAKQAKGTFFVFFDADMIVPPEFLEGIHYTIISRKCFFITTWFATESKKSSDKMLILVINLGMEIGKVIGKPLAHGPNTIVKKEVFFEMKGYNEKLKMSEDYDFTVRVSKAGYDLLILKEPQLIYSLRRFVSQGKLKVLYTWWWSVVHMMLIGPPTTNMFHYEMGGHVHKKKTKLKTYHQIIEGFEKKIKTLFEI